MRQIRWRICTTPLDDRGRGILIPVLFKAIVLAPEGVVGCLGATPECDEPDSDAVNDIARCLLDAA